MAKNPQNAPPERGASNQKIAVKSLKDRGETAFFLELDAAQRGALAKMLDLIEIRKLRFEGALRGLNKADWQLKATLGATVVQACIITGAPVVTRLDEPVTRRFLKHFEPHDTPGESQFDGDDEAEALPEIIDLAEIVGESLALALPEYPRAEGAELGEAVFTAPGTAPLRDEDVKPFAALAALRDKLDE